MNQASVERRRGRRVGIEAPLVIRRLSGSDTAPREETTKNISLAGVYFEAEQEPAFSVGEVVTASVSIPPAQTRTFPFTRLTGRSQVVRVLELPREAREGQGTRYGVALEFGDDVIALAALPH